MPHSQPSSSDRRSTNLIPSISYHVVSYHIKSNQIKSHHIRPCHIKPTLILTYDPKHHPRYAYNKLPAPHISAPSAHNPKLFLTFPLTTLSYSSLLPRHILAASIFAGLSSFGSASILITLISIFSTLWIGDHRSDACSYCSGSSPGGCRMEMQTSPEL